MSRRIRAVEQARCAAGLAGATPVCKIETCQTTQESGMRIKYARKLSFFCCEEMSRKLLVFRFPIMLLKLVMRPMRSALALISLNSQIKTIVSEKVNYRGTQS